MTQTMYQVVVILLGVLCSQVYGAVYQEAKFAKGFEQERDGPIEPEAHEVVPALPLPKEEDTLHKGLESHKKKGDVRAVPPPVDTNQAGVQKDILNLHNTYRRNVAATNMFELTWDKEAQAKAQQWVNKCDYRHPTNTPDERKQYMSTTNYSCGQNIAMSSGYVMSWADVSKMWYDEVKNFTFGQQPRNQAVVGHYTAMVWAKTFQIGCAYAKCKAGTSSEFNFYACNYCPAGNVSPSQYSPYEAGTKCGKCSKNCNNGLCTNPCPFTDEYSNCQQGSSALFPTGCVGSPAYKDGMKPHCKATCNCYGKLLY